MTITPETENDNFGKNLDETSISRTNERKSLISRSEAIKKLALMFHNKGTGEAIKGVQAVVTVVGKHFNIPLGKLASDHNGYMSFDVTHLNDFFKNSEEIKELGLSNLSEYSLGSLLDYLEIIIAVKSPIKFETSIAQHRYGFIKDALFVDVNLDLSLVRQPNNFSNGLISMQNPSLTDWILSSSSFSLNPAYFIGEDGCERLYPANFAISEFRFFQIVRGDQLENSRADIRSGWALEYTTTWQPLGHTLGQIIYSLPLAPGETVKIAVVEWARKSVDSRDEDLTVKEQLIHNTHRDRTISETVEAALSEWQRGGNFMGGNSGAAGVSYGTSVFGAVAGNSHSFGGGYSTSSGDRSVTGSTTQQVSDAFAQVSSSMRELRSTIVIQSDQQEDAKAETRVIANHNHSHALTMLYYEVLRHFKVTTEFMRVRSSLLVKYDAPSFDSFEEIWDHQLILKQILLTEALKGCFDVVEKYKCLKIVVNNEQEPPSQEDLYLKTINAKFTSYSDAGSGDVRLDVLLKNDQLINLWYPESADDMDKTKLDSPNNDFNPGPASERNNLIFANYIQVKYGDVKELIVSYRGSRSGTDGWSLGSLYVEAPTTSGNIILFDGGVARRLNPSEPNKPAANVNDYGNRNPVRLPIIPPQPNPPRDIDKIAYERLTDDERCCLEKLKQHLIMNKSYYQRIIWLSEDPNQRAIRFASIQIDDESLIDKIENRPIDVYGDYVVFPSNHASTAELEKVRREFETAKVEKLMTLPTRGVFGEAMLGHCNASEIIDNTRFWDWQTSPITEEAPEIGVTSTDSRAGTQNLTPTAFPNSIVNIVSPANAPDPTGMAGALNLLGQSNVFRDMSVSNEVSDLLKKLSDNSISIADAANKAREISAKEGGGNSGDNVSSPTNSGSKNPTTKGSSTADANNPTPQLSPQDLMDWMNAVKNSGMSPQDKKDVIQDVKEGAKKTVNPKTNQSAQGKITKDKKFVFQAVDYKGNSIEFQMKATVYDILGDRKVLDNVGFIGYGQISLSFSTATPTIKIILTTDPITITSEFFTVNVPKINKQTVDLITLGETQQIVTVTLKQNAKTINVEEKTKEEAAKTLADEYGAKLGFDKVVAGEILAKNATQTTINKGNETFIRFEVKIPTILTT